jgi:hypothetical protein
MAYSSPRHFSGPGLGQKAVDFPVVGEYNGRERMEIYGGVIQ